MAMAAFSRDEYIRRIRATQARMADAGLELLVAADPANINYLTGYDGWSFYTPQVVCLAVDADEPICIVRGMDRAGGLVTAFIDPDNMVGYPDHYVQAPDKHPMDWIGAHLIERDLGRGLVGVEMDAYYYSARGHAALMNALPDAELTDAGNLVNWVRIVKSEAEIGYMRDAARLVERAMQAGIDAIRPGVRQCDAVADIYDAQIRGTEAFGGEYTSIVPMLPTGIATSTPHLTWSSEPFKDGEATILELAGCRNRYHCPMSRTVQLGKPPTKLADTAAVAVEALNVAIAAMAPGVTPEEVHAAWNRVVSPHGIVKESRMGYSTGLNYPPDWGEHTLSIRPGDRTPLKPGMTIHVMPGIWMDDWGIEISECVLVTESGAERLCDFPQELVVKG